MENVTAWLDKVLQTCQQIEQGHIDIIIDQCGMGISVIPALSGFSPPIQWQSLYQGLPENIYPEDAPLLARIDLSDVQQVQWLYALSQEAAETAPLLVLGTAWFFDTVAQWLVCCIDAQHEGRAGIFRFWDTRLFPYLFSHVLDDNQQNQLHRPVLFWSWQDRDSQPKLLMGSGLPLADDEKATQIVFTDDQFERLMCLCDAKRFLGYEQLPEGLYAAKEIAFMACYDAMLSATQQKIIFDDKRDEWVLAHLTYQGSNSV